MGKNDAVEDFLKDQASDGRLDSEGQFTLDFSKAADKLSAFALPSQVHYLLKIVQVAHHLRAQKVKITIERFRTVVRFRAPSGADITDSEKIFRAFADPLTIKDPIMVDLVSALIGTITEDNLETLWSYSVGHSGRRVYINSQRQFSIKDFTLSQALEPDDDPCSFTLSVLHPKTWKFWLGAKRRASAAKVLESNCRYSGAKIIIDGLEQEINPSSVLNLHLRERQMYQNNYWLYSNVPMDNILYLMASPEDSRFCLTRPSLSAYVVRSEHMNLWASGTRVNNTLKPDGESSAAWMLQFVQEGENVSMRFAPKRVPCRAVLGLNLNNKGKDEVFRVKIVRSGVTVLEKSMEDFEERFEVFRGCILIFADEELETDLTGFQVIENEQFFEKVLSYQVLIPQAREYYERGCEMLTM